MSTHFRFKTPGRDALTALALAGAFVAGGFTLPIVAASAQDAGMRHGMEMKMTMGGAGHGDMHAMMMSHLDGMLTRVDATPDQKARIHAILGDAMKSMGGAHEKLHASMAQLHAIMSAPTIDRGALETIRAADIAEIDAASRTMVKAMADAAEVLRPEQRAKLAAMMQASHPPH